MLKLKICWYETSHQRNRNNFQPQWRCCPEGTFLPILDPSLLFQGKGFIQKAMPLWDRDHHGTLRQDIGKGNLGNQKWKDSTLQSDQNVGLHDQNDQIFCQNAKNGLKPQGHQARKYHDQALRILKQIQSHRFRLFTQIYAFFQLKYHRNFWIRLT
jgi:hypothetical protein